MDIYEALADKVSAELHEFDETYKSMEYMQIINDWYIIGIYNCYHDMLTSDYVKNSLSPNIAEWLLSKEKPLAFIYDDFISSDFYFSEIWDDLLEFITNAYEAEQSYDISEPSIDIKLSLSEQISEASSRSATPSNNSEPKAKEFETNR